MGNKEIIRHQTLSGAGYVFSASAPPFSCTAAQTAIQLMEENGREYVKEIQGNAQLMRKLLRDDSGKQRPRWDMGEQNQISPLIHLRFDDKFVSDDVAEQYLDVVASEARKKGVLVYTAVYLPQEFGIPDKSDPRPSLRICVTRQHTKEQLTKAAGILTTLLVGVSENKLGLQDVSHDHDEEKIN